MTHSLLAVVGARPNFVKMAPVLSALGANGVEVRLLHTGQHYDKALSGEFIKRLGIAEPDANLEVGSGSHGEQTAAALVGIERDLRAHPQQALLTAGDVNSTMAAALAAVKLRVPVVHVESGLRSGDWEMPEEVNRVVTDRVSELLLCTSADAVENLAAEGISDERVRLVGNTMIDSLFRLLEGVDRAQVLAAHELEGRRFALVTLHRPSLVDDAAALSAAFKVLGELAKDLPVVLPAHPRTVARIEGGAIEVPEGIRMLEPMDYGDFVALESEARMVITDSGGVQEESTVLGVPCLTFRTTTERPITVEQGTNTLVGVNPLDLARAAGAEMVKPAPQRPPEIPLWDGQAGPRAAEAIMELLAD
ncbi:MAG: UDP-N-acetylglucosamine 2-epimerase (non-hydrolyzing) [Solirubrobacterales bacterium]|nr:UDP-N-acetylglucosamine 2-epimerase (non-hydrolyzing) [Solirubrobacterales bacterium]